MKLLMNARLFLGVGFGFLSATATTLAAPIVVNDGGTTDGLIRLESVNAGFDTRVELTVQSEAGNSFLQAQVAAAGIQFFPVRQAWYAADRLATGTVYKVAADFRPGQASAERRGGVIGWLDASSVVAKGVALHVRPASEPGEPAAFVLAVADFNANDDAGSESLAGLFNPDGTAATFAFGSALAELGAYNPTNFARFELGFAAPSAADRAALPAVTARVNLLITQPAQGSTTPAPLASGTLLTTLPVPLAATHRLGYFGYRGSIFGAGPIGDFDNLGVDGEVTTPPNTAPTITLMGPEDGAVYTLPTNIVFSANAADADGTIRRVEFFANETQVAVVAVAPYEFVWMNAIPGPYSISAKAVDDRGAIAYSTALVDIIARSNNGPVTTITSPLNNSAHTSPDSLLIAATAADAEGSVARVEFFVDGNSMAVDESPPFEALWLTPPTGAHVLTAVATDDRGAGGPVSLAVSVRIQDAPIEPPKLSIQHTSGSVVVTWPAEYSSFILQTNSVVAGQNWIPVPGIVNHSATFPTTEPARFFRLVGP